MNQLVRKGRRGKKKREKSRALGGQPQMSGVVLRVFILNPAKPNSGERKCCRVRLKNGHEVTAFIPGEGHRIQEHAKVLVQGGNRPDLRGVKYRVVRGPLDGGSPLATDRRNGRSRLAVKRTKSE